MQENIVLKIKFNDDIRRVRLIEKGFIGLQKQIGEIYSIQQGTFTLKYRDDEGDLVTISSEEEFSESFKFIQNNILRLEITSLLEKKEGEGRCKRRWKGKCHKGNRDNHHHGHRHQGQHPFGFIHNITNNLNEGVLNNLINSGLCHIEHNYVCDGCESKIRGTRYHCSECPDFDFCSGCYETKLDSHPEHKFVAITAFDALKEAIGNGEQIDSFFEIFQPGQQQEQVQGSTVDQEHEKEIFEQERHKQQIEKERLEQERIQQEQEQERIKQEQLEKERIEQERLEKERVEQERIKQEQEQEQEKVNQQEEPKNVEPQPQQPQPQPQPNKTFFENFKDILFPLRNPEPVNNDTFEKKLEDLTSMGFDKKECIKALVQNKGNIQKAVEVLLKKK